jgi:hypothetical protein
MELSILSVIHTIFSITPLRAQNFRNQYFGLERIAVVALARCATSSTKSHRKVPSLPLSPLHTPPYRCRHDHPSNARPKPQDHSSPLPVHQLPPDRLDHLLQRLASRPAPRPRLLPLGSRSLLFAYPRVYRECRGGDGERDGYTEHGCVPSLFTFGLSWADSAGGGQ